MVSSFLDFKNEDFEELLKSALHPFGLHIYEHPVTQGSDTEGYIISDKALTREEILNEVKAIIGDDNSFKEVSENYEYKPNDEPISQGTSQPGNSAAEQGANGTGGINSAPNYPNM